jgi:hypothetical protein
VERDGDETVIQIAIEIGIEIERIDPDCDTDFDDEKSPKARKQAEEPAFMFCYRESGFPYFFSGTGRSGLTA